MLALATVIRILCAKFHCNRLLLFHDLLLRSYLYHCVWGVITAHNLTPEKRETAATVTITIRPTL